MIIDIVVPKAGESVTEADIACWLKEDGELVGMDEPVLELETDKASMQVSAQSAGRLKIIVEAGTTVSVGDVIGQIDCSAEAPAAKTEVPSSAPVESEEEVEVLGVDVHERVTNEKFPSPAARKLLIENGLSAQDVSAASGLGGKITKTDVIEFLEKREQNLRIPNPLPAEVKVESPKAKPAKVDVVPQSTEDRPVRVERMSRLRRTVAERLVEAQQTAAILTTFNEVDMTGIMEMRKLYKDKFKEKHDVNLGFMSFFAKAVCRALQDHPIIAAQVDGNNIIYHDFVDLGVAVSTPKGLVVPVIRNAEKLSFAQIEKKILDLAIKGRNADLTPDEMTGGTFTITNGGTFGSMLSTPILNRPQSAILGMHNIVQRPVAINGQVEIRPIMYLALSYDHRIIDGSDAVRFLVKVKECIEDPSRILLEL